MEKTRSMDTGAQYTGEKIPGDLDGFRAFFQ